MSEHKGDTGKTNQVKLESSIDRVIWTSGTGCAGAKAGLEVNTHFVGNNSDIKIEISDKSGKVYETVKSKISGNFLFTQITVPEKAKDELYAEVKLSKHGLTKKSNCMYVFPAVQIKNLKWDKNEARRGDILKLTADVNNVYEGAEAEIQIWEHDSDGAHDLITKFPAIVKNNKINVDWEYEYHEDTDEIPTEEEAERGYNPPEYFFRVNIAGVYADSGLLEFKDWVEIEWLYPNGDPAANKKFKLFLADGSERRETFDANGKFRLEDMPPGPLRVALDDEDEDETENQEDTQQTIKIVLKDSMDNTYSNKKYEIHYGLDTVTGNSSGEGLIDTQIPADVQEARLLVWLRDDDEKASYSTIIQFEQLEPENDTKGIQKRLQGLGFYNGPIDGDAGPMTRDAIKNFQKKNNLPVTGVVNSELSEKINKKFKNS
jgi:hypothetical protein